MENWYYLKEGKTLGPVTIEKIKELILEGFLKAFDPLYKKGATEWLRAVEHEEFTDLFKDAFAKEWILLVSRKGQKLQEGPFSRQQVLQKIITGEASPIDYIWKPGFSEWHLISELEEFSSVAKISYDSEKTSLSADPVEVVGDVESDEDVTGIYEISSEELIKSVYVQAPLKVPSEEEHVVPENLDHNEDQTLQEEVTVPATAMQEVISDEARSVDKAAPVRKSEERKSESGVEHSVSVQAPWWVKAYEFAEASLDTLRSERIVQSAFVAVSAFICVIYLMWSSFQDQALDPKLVAERKTPVAKPVKAKPTKIAPARQVKEASYLGLKVADGQRLVVSTDGQGADKVNVIIYNQVGQIIRQRSFYKSLMVSQAKQSEIHFKKIGLPPGRYRAVATLSGRRSLSKSISFKVLFGISNKEYNRELFRQKKRVAYWAQKEKRQLRKVSGSLLKWTKLIPSKQYTRVRKGLRGALKARQFSLLESKKLVFPGLWAELYQFARSLDQRISGAPGSGGKSIKKEMIRYRKIQAQLDKLSLFN